MKIPKTMFSTRKISVVTRFQGLQRGGGGDLPPWKLTSCYMILYVSLEILVRTPLEKHLDPQVQLHLEGGPYGPPCNTLMTEARFQDPLDGSF